MEGVDLVGFRHDGVCDLGRAFRHFCVGGFWRGSWCGFYARQVGELRLGGPGQSAAAAKNIYRFPGEE